MTPISDMCWTSDIEIALTSLSPDQITDREFYFATVSRIEMGQNPTQKNTKLTMSALRAWVEQCTRQDTDEDNPRDEPAPRRSVRHPRA